ncbi:secreted RxLR effector protein 161-like [Diospyros lotus]|uniref:secreted RxLR effector protein 161-like n=1 Tax=Diospyros lotus TaxID=55363 RepID=UPI002257063C|nr:secreted RxLR effector protein 161-like [Diospyros lotus]
MENVPYANAIGTIMYAMISTRPDLAYAISSLSRFMSNPGDRDPRKSTTTLYFTLGRNCINWKSQLQPLVALSSTEAEYVAVTDAVKEAVWLQDILREIHLL